MAEELKNEEVSNPEPVKEKKSGGLFYIILAAVVLLIVGARVWWNKTFCAVQVDGSSMNQTLQDGEMLLMKYVKDGKGLERGDVIVVDVSGYEETQGSNVHFVIKRLIATEGDKVKCTDGQVSICYAGTQEYVLLEEPYAYYGGYLGMDETNYDFAEYVVGEGEIFFLGDNRLNSCDSRYQERGGSHITQLYKATDVYGVVSEWALENRELIEKILF